MATKLKEIIPHALAPITESGNYQFIAIAINFQNSGNAEIKINSFYTLKPGATLQFSVSDDTNAIITGQWNIRFGAGSTPMLEVMMLIPRDPNYTNYVQQ